ncbi:MAG: radical SAM protein, partial [Anaerolineales bacterium]|nr:radical SAM protein [Anaerolineales bacterium]
CPFCAYSRELRFPREHVCAEQVLAFAEVLRRAGRAAHISWLGGEPLLWPPLAEVSGPLHAHGFSLGLTTNGTQLLNYLDLITHHYSLITISLDGPAQVHDALRGASGLTADLEKAVRELKKRRESDRVGPEIRVNIVLMQANLSGFGELLQTVAGWGVDAVTFNALGGADRPGEFYEREKLTPENVAWLRAQLPHWRERYAPLKIYGDDAYVRRLELLASNNQYPVINCQPGQRFLFINEHGLVSPCSFTTHGYGVPISQIQMLDELPTLFHHRQQNQRHTACDDCRSTQVFGKFDIDP